MKKIVYARCHFTDDYVRFGHLAMDVGNGYSVGIDFIDNSGDGAVGPAFSSGAVISFSKSM